MLTQCPNCQTLFRIRDEQLRTAAGKAHCCRCNSIFNALENLREPTGDTLSQQRATTPIQDAEADAGQTTAEAQPQISLSGLFDDLESEDRPAFSDMDAGAADAAAAQQQMFVADNDNQADADDQAAPERAMANLYAAELDDLFDTGAKFDVDIDVDLDHLEALENLDRADAEPQPQPQPQPEPEPEPEQTQDDRAQPPSDTQPATQKAQRQTRPLANKTSERETDLPFKVPDDLAPIKPTDREAPASAAPGRRGGHTFAWSLLVVVLLLSAMGQAVWLSRDRLLTYPLARDLMQRFCLLAGCQLPARRDPGRIEVLSRSVKTHPEMPRVLQILLTFSNKADFDQPFPQIRLSLYSNNNELIARRRFNAEEYLGSSTSDRSLIGAGQSVSVELALEDPGEAATGFKFDFF